ncbi:four-carbon acid sugar kinase family protein [Acidithiobacillus ferrianus]|uniref:Four-carbon acid sugar kinase family protein n=2 Tax=Acidithiobacillus ferrianus TaxID=2678518 RepID=A0A845U6B4_9PROT|nr:four-carbon acid sugar kinase family protein [Acidithiobacillus ferrianus]NDU41361.1 four-carbon acid sugar kinase family protein [Acidithiobacillus ferrianus]
MADADHKIIVIDDDPTGSQTVHSCLLLTRWDVETLGVALRDAAPLFFILSNTRGMVGERAAAVTRDICRNLRVALDRAAAAGRVVRPILVSRSDSTLRGHYPVETDVMAEELGPFDAHFLVPAFFEGGRITRDGVHYVRQNGVETPVHETEFAQDSVFAFHHGFLPDYVEEKTQGRIPAAAVERFTLAELRAGCLPRLLALRDNVCAVVDAVEPADLAAFARDLRAAAAQGQRFLFRSAASLLTALADLPPQPVAAEDMAQLVRGGKAGAIVVGSHVRKTTEQLEHLLREPGLEAMEVQVDACVGAERSAQLEAILRRAAAAHGKGRDVVIYTSRSERRFADQAARLAFGEAVSAFLMEVVRGLPEDLGFLISKGGITSNDVLSDGLALRMARVMGQILPGCSVVVCPDDHPRTPRLPVVIFPGNVGDAGSLARARRRLRGDAPA